MEVPRCKTRRTNDSPVVIGTAEIEKLRRRKEINARYSRLLLSKTIKHFQKQGHVTICLSEKVHGKVVDEKLTIKQLSTNLQLNEPKNRTISFWKFPKTLTCEFQLETNRAVKSVRTQTNFDKQNKTKDPLASNESTTITARPTNISNEILSSHVSNDGNVMSLVMRSKQNKDFVDDANQSQAINSCRKTLPNDPVPRSPSTPSRKYKSERSPRTSSRKYKSERNVFRSKKFWASYNNFILCNRSIELRITKLYSFQNTQYIVAFSNDFFEYTDVVTPGKETSYESYFVIQFIKFNIEACISETCYAEHIIDLKMQIDWNGDGKEDMYVHSSIDELSSNIVNTSHTGHFYADPSSDERKIKAMTISVLVLSFFVLLVFIGNSAYLVQ